MKAALLYRINEPLVVENVPDPIIPPGWALVKVRAAGVCGTELHFQDGLLSADKSPFILGHEIAGDVVEVPEGMGFRPGDRVSVYNLMNCGYCSYCRSGLDSLCPNASGQIGFNRDGGFAEYVAVPPSCLVHLADNTPYVDGAILACSGMTAVHAVRMSGINFRDTVVINGIGGVGLMVGQVAKTTGARVLAIADTEEKGELARKLFADGVVITKDYANVPDEIKKLTDGKGVDAFFELVGTNGTANAALNSLAKRGRYVIIGYTKEHFDIDPLLMVVNELQIMASVAGTKQDLEDVLRLREQEAVEVFIQSELPLESVNEAIDKIRSRTSLGRNVICFK